jgi:FMN phosphatase YigB (HAD superfamily)
VFFDFGGTLAEEAVNRDVWIWARLRDKGVQRELEAVRAARQVARLLHQKHQPRYGAGVKDQERYWTWWYQQLLGEVGVGGDREALAEWLWLTQTVPHRLYEDTAPALEEMRGRGWRLGVISNWDNLDLEAVLQDLGIWEFFAMALPSAQAGYAKPRPEIFEQALEMIGAQAHEAAHVGDSYRADVMGARGVGILGVLVARGGPPTGGEAPWVPALTEVPALLDGVTGD